MVRIILHKKFVARLLILVYLLIGFGIGNGLIWCQESEAYSHLEYNPSGKCHYVQDGCLTADNQGDIDKQLSLTILSKPSSADHSDISTSISHALPTRDKDFKADTVVHALVPFDAIQVKNQPVARLSTLKLAAQPPPHQALTALKTIVLLN
jgi:hypothetical protein